MTAENIRDLLGLDNTTYNDPEAVTARTLGTVADSIATARRRAGYTQTELGERIGVNQSVVSRIESGTRNVTFATMMKIARATGAEFSIDTHGMSLAPRRDVVMVNGSELTIDLREPTVAELEG